MYIIVVVVPSVVQVLPPSSEIFHVIDCDPSQIVVGNDLVEFNVTENEGWLG